MLGGDGTILQALRTYVGTGVPVFAVNFGEVGFLATVEPDDVADGVRARALAGEFEVIAAAGDRRRRWRGAGWTAINDVSFHRKPGLRVADLAYAVGDEEIGRVRCDGLVVSTPAGSTGYNLANGGPGHGLGGGGLRRVLHRAAFAHRTGAGGRAPGLARRQQRSREEPIDVTVDGRPICELAAGESTAHGASATVSARSHSSRGRRSTTACGRSSAASRHASDAGIGLATDD